MMKTLLTEWTISSVPVADHPLALVAASHQHVYPQAAAVAAPAEP
jgi:hypothetical protein